MTILQFPLDAAMAHAKPLGSGAAWVVDDTIILRASVVRGPRGLLWYRCEGTGMPVRHYQGNITFNEAKDRYLKEQNAIKLL